jgi:hypothetical protein
MTAPSPINTATTVPRVRHAFALTAWSSSFRRRRQPISHAAICPATIGYRDFRSPAAAICLSVSVAAIPRIITTHGILYAPHLTWRSRQIGFERCLLEERTRDFYIRLDTLIVVNSAYIDRVGFWLDDADVVPAYATIGATINQ